MGLLNKASFETLPQLATEDVALPSFGGELRLRDWNGVDRDDFEYLMARRGTSETWETIVRDAAGHETKKQHADGRGIRAAAIAVSAVDENGERLFNMNGDVERISQWPSNDLLLASDIVFRRNKISGDAIDDAKKN